MKMLDSKDSLMRQSSNRMNILLALFIVTVCCPTAHADTGLPMIALMYPMVIGALLPVIAIEVVVISKRLKASKRSVLKSVTIANAVSTLLGYPLTWALSMVGWLLIWGLSKLSNPATHWLMDSKWSYVALMPFQFAWLVPSERQMWWAIPVAGLIGLMPAFFVSWYSEAYILRRMLSLDRQNAKSISYDAQVASYIFLVMIVVAYGVYSIVWHLRQAH